MRSCATADERLYAFVDGLDESLDDHVVGCDECQAFLADLWIGELKTDLTDPVLRQIAFEKFLSDVARLGFDVAGAMARGAIEYTVGRDERDATGGIDRAD